MTGAARAPWIALGATVPAMFTALLLWFVTVDERFTRDIAVYPVACLAFAAVGALILGRQPANRVWRRQRESAGR